MDRIKDDKYYIEKILHYIEFSINSLADKDIKQFEANDIIVNAIMFAFIQISDYSKKLSDAFKENHKDVPWNYIKAMRNKIVHDYDVVDYYIIYVTIKSDFPDLKKKLESSVNINV